MAKTTIKNKQTAEQAAQATLTAYREKKVAVAQAKLSAIIKAWEEETECTFVITGRFSGNQAEAGLQVIYNPKQ